VALKVKGGGLDSLSLVGKMVVGLALLLLFGAGYFIVFYGEIDSSIEAQRQSLVSKQQELEQAKEAKKEYNKDLAEKARREQLALKQRKILPDDSETHAFLASLQQVATISGVKLASWTPLDEEPQQFYAKVPMQLKLQGKFHQVAKFFHGVGQVDRIINMENITVSLHESADKKAKGAGVAAGGEDEQVQVQVECLATAFRSVGADDAQRRPRRGGQK
jgi:type IV pilus assembly protein PilO